MRRRLTQAGDKKVQLQGRLAHPGITDRGTDPPPLGGANEGLVEQESGFAFVGWVHAWCGMGDQTAIHGQDGRVFPPP
jgi:hypothetical protein